MIRVSDKRGLFVGLLLDYVVILPHEARGVEYDRFLTLDSFDFELTVFSLAGVRGGDTNLLTSQQMGILRELIKQAIKQHEKTNR